MKIKKKLSYITAMIIASTLAMITAVVSYNCEAEGKIFIEPSIGDIDLDGIVSNSDLLMLRDLLVGICKADEHKFMLADINYDGNLNVIDMMMLKRIVINSTSNDKLTAVTTAVTPVITTTTTTTTATTTSTITTAAAAKNELSLPDFNSFVYHRGFDINNEGTSAKHEFQYSIKPNDVNIVKEYILLLEHEYNLCFESSSDRYETNSSCLYDLIYTGGGDVTKIDNIYDVEVYCKIYSDYLYVTVTYGEGLDYRDFGDRTTLTIEDVKSVSIDDKDNDSSGDNDESKDDEIPIPDSFVVRRSVINPPSGGNWYSWWGGDSVISIVDRSGRGVTVESKRPGSTTITCSYEVKENGSIHKKWKTYTVIVDNNGFITYY